MNTHKPFLNPGLSLLSLSKELKISSGDLSSLINSSFNLNFNDFINGYRVAEFKQQIYLPDNKNFTILSVALDCGFNSKSTFNRAFKKSEGKSPKEWKDLEMKKRN